MNDSKLQALKGQTDCEVRCDDLTRQLYATDASIYQIEPMGVAFPQSAAEAQSVFRAAYEADIPLVPRGAGTGLAGGAVGEGLVVDFSGRNRTISDFDRERRRIKVGPGVVLDQLNAFAKPHGLTFGPDVATSSRATLGGMISNNSSGARAPVYGTTVDHVVSLDVLLADGTLETIGADHNGLSHIHDAVATLIEGIAPAVDERFPEGLVKRWPGYGFDRWLRGSKDLTRLIGGSEGTLVGIVGAELSLVPLPREKGIGLIFFASVAEAMEATVELLDLDPVAIEHIDDVLFDQTKGQLQFRKARALLELDDKPCESILIVEFFDDVEGRLADLEGRNLGLRRTTFTHEEDMEQVWLLRKAGLSLLTGCKGDAKPTAGLEDTAVLPSKLPAYVESLRALMEPLGLRASFYGHAASGLLHVRPVVDLHRPEDIKKFRQLADGVSALVREFKGSIAAEHGVGIARSEYVPEHLGTELTQALATVKRLFDPKNLMNPGKILENSAFKIDHDLRQGAERAIDLPFEAVATFAAKDMSFVGNLEQCNGCGGCLKDGPTMCPTFIATGEEIMSTRGRANVIRAVLEKRLPSRRGVLDSEYLRDALGHCLSCKACTVECPSNVNMALLKAELLHGRQQQRGITLFEHIVSRVDAWGAMASLAPRLANSLLSRRATAYALEKLVGLSAFRPFPAYAVEPFHRWFNKGGRPRTASSRGQVILWDDCFVRYNEPWIGKAAVRVLEEGGFEVLLPKGRACCGRPAFSTGRLDLAEEFGRYNLDLLEKMGADTPVVFLEPSCYSMFADDYKELSLPSFDDVAGRVYLFEEFMGRVLGEEPDALPLNDGPAEVAIHVHCHARALTDSGLAAGLAEHVPNSAVTTLDSGCCGMAGAFGQSASNYELSLKIAGPLVELVDALDASATVVACGASCRQQLEHLTQVKPIHIAELMARALGPTHP